MAVPWAWAFDTPFSWTKMVASRFGGTKQGMAISWPKVIKDKGGIRWQFHHFIDIVPTILEATGIRTPEVVDGFPQKPIEGVSIMYIFDKKSEMAPSTHKTQYFEMIGDHAIYHDGWIASTKVIRVPWDNHGPAHPDPAGWP
jgi:arylsulfatase